MKKSQVYFTKSITSGGLLKIYEALNAKLKGKVAVKISTGEPGGHNFLNPSLIEPLVSKLQGTIVECNTAYAGRRNTTTEHKKVLKEHGFSAIAPSDIMDEEGDIKISVPQKGHLKGYNIVGSHINNYDSMLMLSHFKGHQMGGFGGALKNMSIGVASSAGKAWIHSAGYTSDVDKFWGHPTDHDAFLESMAEACSAVIAHFGEENMAYISVLNNLSIDCDCNAHPTPPEMKDIGIFASLDPVALDQCCYDTIINSKDGGKASLIERMDSRHAIHTVKQAHLLGLGNREYELISLD